MKNNLFSETNLIDSLLAEQQSLSAVERFAQKHDQNDFHAQSRYYEDLIPLSKPTKGQQYAFAVDLDRCTGCKACVTACHSLNGLEEEETWRDTGLIIGGHQSQSYQQTVTTACHHCLEPACLEGCPVKAYDKDEETGIVRHLDDQCIGCQYCTMKCPYDVPKYSVKLGIVRKCDMCHERLAVGQAPACVQACPHEAITIRIVDSAEVRAQAVASSQMLPGAFDSSYTKPTTTYSTTKAMPSDTHAADSQILHLEHAHWPLLIMLVFSQCAVGISLILAGMPMASDLFAASALPLAALSFALLNIGLIAAVFHLGRPLGAWRFFLGLRTSWMSREILAFSLYAGVSSAVVGLLLLGNPWVLHFIPPQLSRILKLLPLTLMTEGAIFTSALMGLIGVFTSAMIYIDTHRSLWRAKRTFPRFYLTTLALGLGVTSVVFSIQNQPTSLLIVALLIVGSILYAWEVSRYSDAFLSDDDPDHLSSGTIHQHLSWFFPLKGLLIVSWVVLLTTALFGSHSWPLLTVAFLVQLCSQLLERFVFFTCVIPLRMPRGI